MKKIIILTTLLSGCELSHDKDTASPESNAKVTTSKSIESLDRTLADMDKLITDMEKMNNNLEAIFRAVTDCKSEEECQLLSEKYAKKFEENKGE